MTASGYRRRAAPLLGLLFVGCVGTAAAVETTPTLELGFDSYLQQFRLTEDLLGDLDSPDASIERGLRDTTEVFTEFRARGDLAFASTGERVRWNSRASASAGTDLYREALDFDLRAESLGRSRRLSLRAEAEARQFRDDSDFSLSSDLIEGRATLHLQQRASQDWVFGVRGRGAWIDYATPSTYELDSRRADLSLTTRVSKGFDSYLDLEAGGGRRAHPDSTQISYDRAFAYADVGAGFAERWRAGLSAGLERRVYDDPATRSPFWDLLVEPRLERRTDSGGRAILGVDLEWLRYDTDGSVFYDTLLGRALLGLQTRHGSWTFGVEPAWSWLSSPLEVDERFQQPSVAVEVDYFGVGRLWLSLREEVGWRDFVEAADEDLRLYSDYLFLRSTLLLSIEIRPGLSVDGFLSDEPKNHQLSEDDGRLTVFTLSLKMSF